MKTKYFKFWYGFIPNTFWIVKQLGWSNAKVIYARHGDDAKLVYVWKLGEVLPCIKHGRIIFGTDYIELTEDEMRLEII